MNEMIAERIAFKKPRVLVYCILSIDAILHKSARSIVVLRKSESWYPVVDSRRDPTFTSMIHAAPLEPKVNFVVFLVPWNSNSCDSFFLVLVIVLVGTWKRSAVPTLQ